MSLKIYHPLALSLSQRQTLLAAPAQFDRYKADLHVGWWDISTRELLERVFQNGFFANQPEIGKEFTALLHQYVQEDRSRHEIYSRLRRMIVGNRLALQSIAEDSQARVQRRLMQLQEFLPESVASYLDLGNGNGEITEVIAKHFGLNPSSAVGVDMVARAEDSPYYRQEYISPEESLPFEENSVQIVTMLMVLHHLRNPETALREVYRILEPGGILLVRESDVPTAELKNFNAIMEDFYYRVFNYFPTIPIPNLHVPAAWWLEQAQKLGFDCVRAEAVEDQNPFTPVYLCLQKKV